MAEYIEREDALTSLIWKGQESKRYKYGEKWELNYVEIKDAIAKVHAADVVSRAVLEQIKWERDVAVEQLKELGYGLGEKIVRCRDCKFGEDREGGAFEMIEYAPDQVRLVPWYLRRHVEKKILPEYFKGVLTGAKTYELRKDEDGIQAGDVIVLMEWDRNNYTGRFVRREVVSVLRNCPEYGLKEGYCILALQPPRMATGDSTESK